MSRKVPFFLIICLCLIAQSNAQTGMCNDSIILIRNSIGYFYSRAYSPPILSTMMKYLNGLQASILSAYQICFNKIIINPDSLYIKNNSNCLAGLFNTSLLASKYSGQPDRKIYAEIDSIAEVTFQTVCNCKEVIYYSGWINVSSDCTNGMADMDDLLNKYDDNIVLGGDGIKYLNDLMLATERQRKNCGFNPLIKAGVFKSDTCQSININWLAPIADQFETVIAKKNVLNYTSYFYMFYQSIGRAQKLCVNNTIVAENFVEEQEQ
jgi:hypothetical protein